MYDDICPVIGIGMPPPARGCLSVAKAGANGGYRANIINK